MQRIRHHAHGGPDVLRVEEVDDLRPGLGEVRIDVEVAGVHLVDTTIRSGGWGEQQLPMTPGREVAGRVGAIGPDVDESWQGRRVVAHLGTASGGYAEQVVTDTDRLHGIPELLTSDTAVAAIGTGRTATGILDLAPIGPDDRVVVTAASGGLGSLLVRAALAAGAPVVGLANGPVKADVVRRLGPTAVVDIRRPGWIDAVTATLGTPTMTFDGVGGDIAQSLYGLLDEHGVLVNYTGADPAEYRGPAEVRPVLGPAMTSRPGGLRSLEEESLARATDGSRVPVVGSTFALHDAAEAHRALEARETWGKVVLVTGADRA